jgi:hypothetical protein
MLTRYESWPIMACLLVAIVLGAWMQFRPPSVRLHVLRTLDRVGLTTLMTLITGIGGWVGWNQIIFGNPLGFQNGEFAKPSQWVGNVEPAIGHWGTAAKTFWYAMVDDLSLPVLIFACIGLVSFLVLELRQKRTAVRALPVLSLMIMLPFFVASLYTGQRPLHVNQFSHGLYNVRFALIMLLPAAIFIGYLVGSLQRLHVGIGAFVGGMAVIIAGLATSLALATNSVYTYQEPLIARHETAMVDQDQVVAYAHQQYRGGHVLLMSFGNEIVGFNGFPTNQVIYEGSYRQWEPAVRDPAGNHIGWIVIRCGGKPDDLCLKVGASQLASYDKVFTTGDGVYRVYRRR